MIIRKYLYDLKYFTIPLPLCVSPSPSSTSNCLTMAQIDGFINIRDQLSIYASSTFHVEPSIHSRVIDNSANICVIKDKYLFTSDIRNCLLGINIGTVISNNKSHRIGTAAMVWYNKSGTKHCFLLKYALYYPDSSVNVISVTKLGQDECDSTLNIQAFPTYSIFTWNHGHTSHFLYYSAINLPELHIYPTIHHSEFTTHHKNNHITLFKEDQLALFKDVSSSDLHDLNSPSLSPLQ